MTVTAFSEFVSKSKEEGFYPYYKKRDEEEFTTKPSIYSDT